MGSDLQLTGLASGFDWKPVVEQLVELEAIPKKRLQSEKSSNEGKISDLGLLKSQLDTLNGASKALSNEDLYDARKITLDSDSAAVLSASAAAGTLTGTYKVEVVSLASNTQMTSENRIVNGLGNSLQSHLASTPLSDLPLQSDITAGTFSIGGRTFNITDLSMSLQDLIDEVNNNGAGFDPEKDGTYITLEYDTVNDRMIIDGGDISTGGSPSIPILGSPTDTSNFLQVMRLLNRTPDAPRLADYESWSGISIYTGNASKAWVRPDDQTESPGQTDDRIYTAYDPVDIAGQSNKLLYRRKESTGDVKFLTHRNKVSTTALNHAWDANSIAYQDGFLFKLKSTKAGSFATDFNTIYNPKGSTPPASATSSKLRVVQGNSAPLTHIERNGFWELGLNLEGANGNVDTGQAFGEAVASHNPTNNTSQYKQGDIVNAGATFDASNGYFRAVKDRALAGGSSQDWNNYETSGTAWASEAGALWQNNLPVSVYSAGRMFKINAGLSAFEHTGNSSVSLFTTGAGWDDVNKLVVGNNGVAGAKSKYFRPKETAWDAIETNKATFEAGNDFNWTAGAVVQTNSKFYKATGRWDNADPSAPVANKLFSLKTDNATHADGYGKMWVQDSYVQDITHSDKDFYKAEAAWGSVSIHTGATTINNSNKDDVVLNNSNKEFYQAKGNFTTANISIHQTSTLYKHFDPGSDPTHVTNDAKLNDRMVEDGTTNNFYTAGVNWANTTNFTAGGDVTAFNASNFVKIGTNFYDSQTDFTALPSHSANNNFNSGVIVKIGTGASTAFYKAKANVASVDGAGASFLTAAQVIPMISDTRVLDNTGGVVYKASANLANLENFDATAHTTYKTAGIVVNNGGTFYESTSTVWSDVENTAFTAGTSPTAGLTANTSIVRLNTTGDYYKIKGDWGNSAVFPSASAVNSGTTVKDSGGIFYKLDQDFLGDTSGTRTPSGAGEWVKDATSSKYYKSKGTDDSSSILDTTKWDEFADFNAAVTAGLATDVDDNVKLNTPPAPSNDFWEKVTDDLTPSPTNTSGAWTTTLTNNSPTDLTNTHYWNPYADATDPSSNPSSNAIWENVTDKANLTAPPAGTANDFWADVTTAATTLTGGGASVSWWNEANSGLDNPNGTTATNVFWKDVSSDIFDFDNSGGSGMAATYWGASNVTAELTDPTAVGFSNWWSDETANINNLNDVGNSNLVDSYWDKVNLATSNTTYWTEYAHANSWTDFDHEYWQKVEPGMARLIGPNGLNPAFTTPNLTEGIAREHQNPDPSGYDWSDYVRQQDMTIWKRVANIHGYRGGASTNGTGQTDGAERFGDHDTEETSGRPSGAIQAWNNTDYYEAGDVVKKGTGTGTKYYRMRRSGINNDPEDDDWASAGTGIVDPSKLNYVDDNNVYSPNSTDTSFQKWPGAASWDLIWDNSVNGAPTSDDNVYKLSYTDTDYWERIDTPPPISTSMATNAGDPWWELVQETTISSSQALGTVDLSAKIKDANFAGFDIKHFTHDGTLPIAQGGTGLIEDGAFFVGEGAGAVRISYNIENDSISDLMNRVSNSDAGVTMFYDPVGDRFVLRNDKAGAVGLTLHESPTDAGTFNPNPPFEWDTVSGNRGNGNVLQLMGLVDKTFQGDSNFGLTHDQAYPYYNDSAAYSKGDTVKLRIGNLTKWSYWRANENISAGEGEPSVDTPKWVQVVPGVGRAIMSELGTNSTIKLNDSNNLIYSNESVFGVDSHGYKGLNIDVTKASIGDIGTFTVSKDTSQAKSAIDKFVEEFNDAQDYIRSLTVVTNDGERVSSGKFSSNIEISRLGSQLRKVVFGDSIAHSRSELTTDGADLTIGSDTDVTNNFPLGSLAAWDNLATELELKTDGTGNGYIVKIQIDSTNGNKTSYKIWEDQGSGTWGWTHNHKPTFSSFRISDIGLDFGIGSDRLQVRNSAALLEALENNSDMVKALFAESRVESTSESTDDDLNLTPKPKTLNNGDPNNPTATDITATGQVIANSAAFDLNTGTYRPYQGLSDGLDEFISAFLTGDEDSGYKGAYNTHIESIRSQNKRIDERIEDMERYLEQREKTLSDGFMRMEEMQSQLNTQLQTLQNSFKK